MKVGDNSEFTRTFTAQDLRDYAQLSGHKSAIKSERVPGPLIDVLISYALGEQQPGHGVVYLEQETHYQSGAVIDKPLTAKAEITQLRPDEKLAEFATTCRSADGTVVARGRALVHFGDLAHEDCNLADQKPAGI